ncbi:MAG: hypothetical protein LBR95_04505, partial [Azoarcus sp.]|nr:hypothetical protein [Azoarcus sp.]
MKKTVTNRIFARALTWEANMANTMYCAWNREAVTSLLCSIVASTRAGRIETGSECIARIYREATRTNRKMCNVPNYIFSRRQRRGARLRRR